MFNLYQHMKNNDEKIQTKESETTGHDRFYQERSRSSYRKKKRRGACKRAQSTADLNPESVAAANRRIAFGMRSVSTDKEDSEEDSSERAPLVAQKIDSLAKMLFNKTIIGSGSGKSSPSETHPPSPKLEQSIEGAAALAICSEYLSGSPRYALLASLPPIGSRPDKHWFAVHDNSIKTDRLLTLTPLPPSCPMQADGRSRSLALQLFRSLHHPYIYPVLDIALCAGHALVVLPFNASGTLKDLIYKSTWSEEYCRKYSAAGCGLPPWQVARFGRQVLEGLLFLADKGLPPLRHLHAGNVVVQNGVARISGVENCLLGLAPRPCPTGGAGGAGSGSGAVELAALLLEMCSAREPDFTALGDLPPEYGQVVETISLLVGGQPPPLGALVLSDLFRKIDLREMKGSCLPNFNQRLSRSCLSLLGALSRSDPPPAPTSHPASPGTPSQRRSDATTPSSTNSSICHSCSNQTVCSCSRCRCKRSAPEKKNSHPKLYTQEEVDEMVADEKARAIKTQQRKHNRDNEKTK